MAGHAFGLINKPAEAALLGYLRVDICLPTTTPAGRAVLQGTVGLIDGHVFSVFEGGQAMTASWTTDQMIKRPPGDKFQCRGE